MTHQNMAKTILYVDHTAKMGGGEVALFNLVTSLDRTRFTPVVVLASEGRLADRLRTHGVETHVLPLDPAILDTRKDSLGLRSVLRLQQSFRCLAYAGRLARFARTRGAAMIHTNSLKSDLYGGLAGRLARVPVVWHVRDHIDAQYLPGPVAAAFRALARWVPSAVITNSQSTLRRLDPSGLQQTAVVYSGVVAESFSPPLGGQVRVIHDGYNQQDFGAEGVSREAPGSAVTLIGRIAPWKGQHIFLKAAAAVLPFFPEARFRVVGSPLFGEHEYEQSLHALARELGIASQVEFLGFREDVPAVLAETDVVVHASTLGEPFGQVVIEGMAAGKPVIATDGGALPEIVEDGKTGLLVPMDDAPALAAAVTRLLNDPALARSLGRAGQQRVQDRFTIRHTVAKVEALYEQMLAPRLPTAEAAPQRPVKAA